MQPLLLDADPLFTIKQAEKKKIEANLKEIEDLQIAYKRIQKEKEKELYDIINQSLVNISQLESSYCNSSFVSSRSGSRTGSRPASRLGSRPNPSSPGSAILSRSGSRSMIRITEDTDRIIIKQEKIMKMLMNEPIIVEGKTPILNSAIDNIANTIDLINYELQNSDNNNKNRYNKQIDLFPLPNCNINNTTDNIEESDDGENKNRKLEDKNSFNSAEIIFDMECKNNKDILQCDFKPIAELLNDDYPEDEEEQKLMDIADAVSLASTDTFTASLSLKEIPEKKKKKEIKWADDVKINDGRPEGVFNNDELSLTLKPEDYETSSYFEQQDDETKKNTEYNIELGHQKDDSDLCMSPRYLEIENNNKSNKLEKNLIKSIKDELNVINIFNTNIDNEKKKEEEIKENYERLLDGYEDLLNSEEYLTEQEYKDKQYNEIELMEKYNSITKEMDEQYKNSPVMRNLNKIPKAIDTEISDIINSKLHESSEPLTVSTFMNSVNKMITGSNIKHTETKLVDLEKINNIEKDNLTNIKSEPTESLKLSTLNTTGRDDNVNKRFNFDRKAEELQESASSQFKLEDMNSTIVTKNTLTDDIIDQLDNPHPSNLFNKNLTNTDINSNLNMYVNSSIESGQEAITISALKPNEITEVKKTAISSMTNSMYNALNQNNLDLESNLMSTNNRYESRYLHKSKTSSKRVTMDLSVLWQ